MKILSLHIDGFGKLSGRDLSFEDGLNVVYGKNEAGKSTLHTFIRGMLFGIERQRGRASKNDTYSRFEPWSGTGAYQGWLRLESQGEVFRIERRFQKGNKNLTVINETKGREETPSAALWDRLRCGLSETAYSNTISIGQLKSATDGGMVSELRNYIANLNTSGSIALNITKASALLKSQRREMAAKLVPEAAKRYAALAGEIRTIEHEISDPRYQNRLASCQADLTQLKETLKNHRAEKESLLEKAARGRQILLGNHLPMKPPFRTSSAGLRRLIRNTGKKRLNPADAFRQQPQSSVFWHPVSWLLEWDSASKNRIRSVDFLSGSALNMPGLPLPSLHSSPFSAVLGAPSSLQLP